MGQTGGGLAQFVKVACFGLKDLGATPCFDQPDCGAPRHGQADQRQTAGKHKRAPTPRYAAALRVNSRTAQQQNGEKPPPYGKGAFIVRPLQRPAPSPFSILPTTAGLVVDVVSS